MDPADERALPASDQRHFQLSIQGFIKGHGGFVDLDDAKGDNLDAGNDFLSGPQS